MRLWILKHPLQFILLTILGSLILLPVPTLFAQSTIVVTGKIVDAQEDIPVSGASIRLESGGGTVADSTGTFSLSIVSGSIRQASITISRVGYLPRTLSFAVGVKSLKLGIIRLRSQVQDVAEVSVDGYNANSREQVSTTTINPRLATVLPSPFGDFNKILATLPGVVSNSELSSQYSVRGGNYDENLVYVNDIEIYKPVLVRQGQQEGLSFVNPDLVAKTEFSAGGWQARYGDRLSSVLAVKYKQPTQNHGSVQLGILSQTAHIELGSPKSRWNFIGGVRRKSAQYLLSNSFLTRGLDVQGQYLPQSADGQAQLTYKIRGLDSNRFISDTRLIFLSSLTVNQFLVRPEQQETTFGNFSALLKLTVAFDGIERLTYNTLQNGLTLATRIGNIRTELTGSYIRSSERERNNVEGGYRLCDIETDRSKDRFNQCVSTRGIGTFFNYARNKLDAEITGILVRNYWNASPTLNLEFGGGVQEETIVDKLDEYSFIDSADYIRVTQPLETSLRISSTRANFYVQNRAELGSTTVVAGLRGQYWSLNKELLLSPRLQVAQRMNESGTWILKVGGGSYAQSPFYRELRDRDGRLFTDLKAQRSYHFIGGTDHALRYGTKPFRVQVEAYFKTLPRIIPYDVDNVRIRYLPSISGRAYAYGADARISGEFIRGNESWFSFGYLKTSENIVGDSLALSGNQKTERGDLRRPSDQRATLGIFFQDNLPNNPSFKVYVNTVIGSGLPFGPPGNLDYRNFFSAPWYRRIDIGFSKVITLGDKTTKAGRYFESIAIGLDVLNLVGANNVISYLWIKDVNDLQFGIPNYLSARFFNLKVRVEI
jgi:hypothetical protein